jgi:hypothetical protein
MQCYTSAASQNILHDSLITVQRGPNILDVYIKAAGSVSPHHSTPSVDVSRFLVSPMLHLQNQRNAATVFTDTPVPSTGSTVSKKLM